MKIKAIGVFLILLILNGAGFYIWNRKAAIESQAHSNLLKQVTHHDILEDIRTTPAKVTLVNLWATWCDPCKEEMPYILKLYKEYKSQGLRVMLVSMDFESQTPDVLKFLHELNVDFVTFVKNENEMEFINGLLPQWSGALPVTAIFNQAGKLDEFWQGDADYARFEKAVLKQLKGEAK